MGVRPTAPLLWIGLILVASGSIVAAAPARVDTGAAADVDAAPDAGPLAAADGAAPDAGPLTAADGAAADADVEPLPDIYQFSVEVRPEPGTFNIPAGAAAGLDGTVYVLDMSRVQQFSADGNLQRIWGGFGSEEGRFNTTGGVAVAPPGAPSAGEVFVADTQNDRVQRFAPDGTFLGVLGSDIQPPLDVPIDAPIDVAVATDGTVYVLSGVLDRIVVFPPGGAARDIDYRPPRELVTGDASLAMRIAAGAGGRVYAALPSQLEVHAIDPDGSIGARWGRSGEGRLSQPLDVAIGPDGTVWVVDPTLRQLLQYTADGRWLRTLAPPGLTGKTDLDVASDGTIFAAGGGGVVRIDPDASVGASWEAPLRVAVGSITDLAVAPDQTVHLAAYPARVHRLRPDGAHATSWGQPGPILGQLKQMAFAGDGTLYLTDSGKHAVHHFGADGTYLGTPITGGDGADQVEWPDGIAVAPDGSLAVADFGHYRILRFTPAGSLLATLGAGVAGIGKHQFLNLRGVAVAPDGTLYATDYNPSTSFGTLKRYSPDGALLGWWMAATAPGDPLGGVDDVAVSPSGTVYVTNGSRDRVVRFDPRGRYLDAWGRTGFARGELWRPYRIALDGRGRAWVAEDSAQRRLHVFGPDLPGTWHTETFTNPWLAGWPAQVDESRADLAWDETELPAGMATDGWSARSTRTLYRPGVHRLRLAARGGVRLWVGRRLVVDAWQGGNVDAAPEVELPDAPVVVHAEYRDIGGPGYLALTFEPIAIPPQLPSPTRTAWPTVTPTSTPLPTATAMPARIDRYLPALANGPWASIPVPTPEPAASPAPPWLGHPEIDVQAYDVDLAAPALGEGDLRATVTITLATRAALDRIDLDADPRAILVHGVAAGGRKLGHGWSTGAFQHPAIADARLRVRLGRTVAAGEVLALTIDYSIRREAIAASGRGFRYNDWYIGARVLYTRSVAAYARAWLPSNDHPSDPAAIRYALRVPPGTVGAANGRLLGGDYAGGEGRDAAGLTVFRWVQERPIPTYLFNVVIGEFAVDVREVCFDTATVNRAQVDCAVAAHRVPVAYYWPPAMGSPTVQARQYRANLDRATEALIYFSSVFEPYPWDKLGVAMVPHPEAMEYATLIALELNQSSAAVHEVIHAWWGNAVRFGHWGDTWISEGFTDYFTGFFDEVTLGRMTGCRQVGERLVRPPQIDPDKAYELVVYCKGAAAIDDLRARMAALAGRQPQDAAAVDLFLAVMTDVYRTFRFRSVTTDDLVAHIRARLPDHLRAAGATVGDAAAHDAVDAWRRSWIERPLPADAVVEARWGGGEETIWAIERNTWLAQLRDVGPIDAPLAPFGTACNGVAPTRPLTDTVALVERGTCTFAEKMTNAAAQGAAAVVMFNSTQAFSTLNCPAPCTAAPGIPGVMIERDPGLALRARLEAGTAVTVTLRTEP